MQLLPLLMQDVLPRGTGPVFPTKGLEVGKSPSRTYFFRRNRHARCGR